MTRLDDILASWGSRGPLSTPSAGKLAVTLGDTTVAMEVRAVSEDEAELRVRWPAPAAGHPDLGQLAQAVSMNRAGVLRCDEHDGGLAIVMPLFLEGLSRQEFVSAACEVGRATLVLVETANALAAQQETIDRAQKMMAELEAKPSVTDLLAQAAAPAQTGSTFVVAEGGAPAWSAPDPSAAPVATLAVGTELEVRERRGDWANVVASNGWSGWVDGRRLVAR